MEGGDTYGEDYLTQLHGSIGEDEYSGPEWQPWKFGMAHEDYYMLMNEFNTVPSAIQQHGAFRDDFETIARDATSKEDLRVRLEQHRQAELRFWRSRLEMTALGVLNSYRQIPFSPWNDLLDLVATTDTAGPEDMVGWQSPVSLQKLIETLQHIQGRVLPTAPPAIGPPSPVSSNSSTADQTRPSSSSSVTQESAFNSAKVAQVSRSLRKEEKKQNKKRRFQTRMFREVATINKSKRTSKRLKNKSAKSQAIS